MMGDRLDRLDEGMNRVAAEDQGQSPGVERDRPRDRRVGDADHFDATATSIVKIAADATARGRIGAGRVAGSDL
jgi:hypothetical protein